VGTPDHNGCVANPRGYAVLKVVGENPINANNGDQADVQVTGQITDGRRKANPSQLYTGQIQLNPQDAFTTGKTSWSRRPSRTCRSKSRPTVRAAPATSRPRSTLRCPVSSR